MKFGVLKSIGHNIADSFACGNGFLIGHYGTDVFAEAANSRDGYILVDFIAGTTSGGPPSESLAEAIVLYAKALDELCQRHGTRSNAFRELKVRYSTDSHGQRFEVAVENQAGRRSTDEYIGLAAERVKERDALGFVRPKRYQLSQDTD